MREEARLLGIIANQQKRIEALEAERKKLREAASNLINNVSAGTLDKELAFRHVRSRDFDRLSALLQENE